jgi:hypothetical protein
MHSLRRDTSYRQALELQPDYAAAYNNLGNALKDQGKLDEAVVCYRRALELKLDYAEVHNNLGSALEETGDFRGAEDSFRAALRHNSRFASAHYKLAELLGGKLPEKDLAAQRRLLEDKELPDAQQLFLHFGLARAPDARGEYAKAAEHLDRGNALQLSEWRKCGQEYDPKEHECFITQMIRVCTPDFFERVRGFGLESEIPVFIVGLPRAAQRAASLGHRCGRTPMTVCSPANGSTANRTLSPWRRSADIGPCPNVVRKIGVGIRRDEQRALRRGEDRER